MFLGIDVLLSPADQPSVKFFGYYGVIWFWLTLFVIAVVLFIFICWCCLVACVWFAYDRTLYMRCRGIEFNAMVWYFACLSSRRDAV